MSTGAGRKYFLQQFMHHSYTHGGIGCVDAEKILLRNNFEPILLPHYQSFTSRAKLSRLAFIVRQFFSIRKGAVVVFIFPLYARMDKWLISLLSRKKNIQIVCLLADIDGLKDGDSGLLSEDIRFFKRFKYFIVHNEAMRQWLTANVPVNITGELGFFDFLTPPLHVQRQLSNNIVFAGNLEKSGFLESLPLLRKGSPHLHFHLYGDGMPAAILQQPGITYHGVSAPYDLPAQLSGSFGLLWDGDSINGPAGSLGHYMQYISHHKLSLYIISRLPIIAPASAASAPMITKYGIGFVINSLHEIESKINSLTEKDYLQMQDNMHALAERISKGECLEHALSQLKLPQL